MTAMSDKPEFLSILEQAVISDPKIEEASLAIRKLSQLENYGENDPNCLLGHRYLSRQGGLLFVAPTGTGKSTAIIQMALLWSIGKPAFGIYPRQNIRTLIVQAENDDGDLAEMRDGVLRGMTASGLLTEPEAVTAADSVSVVRDVVSTGDEVGPALDAYIAASECDMVVLDPVFSYLGGETNSAKDVGHFLRNVINPVLLARNVGFIAVHHSNKPLNGQQKQEWQAGDFAYLGAGSAEFANWARAVLAIRSVGSHDVFQLVAGKRGKRIGWEDEEDGSIVTSRAIKHSGEGLCWLDASEQDVIAARNAIKTSKPEKPEPDLESCVELVCSKIWRLNEFKGHIRDQYQMSRDAAAEFVNRIADDWKVSRARFNENRCPVYVIGAKKDIENYMQNRGDK